MTLTKQEVPGVVYLYIQAWIKQNPAVIIETD